ncbi:protein NnrT [Maritimibacter sp. HL-12]|uniref:protein NnrT n=1 Tax=Maritimibacter sp. HL-12 TaxID=1162418 RepID=UPI000A0EFB4C|nr:protein NnrT [Maritimibacter sp. HL-12]SMH28577.1 hypothetical protein SAMN05661107_0006 [Maritimibacter sp. HL-12]
MRILTPLMAMMLASPALAKSFDRPIPQAQSATAEIWFALSSVALIAALVLVHRLVVRR